MEPRKVLIFGTFDILHAGHEHMIRQARSLGDYIIAVIARDETVKKIKGQYPYHDEDKRLKNLKNSKLVDRVVLGSMNDKYEIIRKTRPDVIALGYDQFAFTFGLEKLLIDEGIDAQIHRLKPYKPQVYKSSLIRNTLVEREHQPLIPHEEQILTSVG
jgi:FAD synthetase